MRFQIPCAFIFVLIAIGFSLKVSGATQTPQTSALPLPIIENQNASNSIRAWSYSKGLDEILFRLEKVTGDDSSLPIETRFKLIAIVAARNNCLYCLCGAIQGLNELKVGLNQIQALQGNLEKGPFTKKEFALLKLGEELTLNPRTSSDWTRKVTAAGWSSKETAHAIFLISHFNMLTRIAKAFDLPPDQKHPYQADQKLPMTSCSEKQ
jgi:alkylhydroperoxidase family enzyme